MRSSRINGEAELRGQPANPGSPGKTAVKRSVTVCGMTTLGTDSCVIISAEEFVFIGVSLFVSRIVQKLLI